jgi:hypothetical protein
VPRRTWVIEDDEEHLAPEVSMQLVVDESAKGATCLRKRGSCTSVAEKRGDDDDLLDDFRRERAEGGPSVSHAPAECKEERGSGVNPR